MLFSDMIQKVVRKLAMVNGAGVQLYSEDRIADYLQEVFNQVFDEEWWPQYRTRLTRTLDGVGGVVTEAITTITRYSDIRFIQHQNVPRPIPELDEQIIPELITGTTPRFVVPTTQTGKLFKIYPLTSVGTVYIAGRAKPTDFTSDTDVDFDADVLINGAAWHYSEDDGTNPGATEKFQTLFESRLTRLRKDVRRKPINLDPASGYIPSEWNVY